MPEGPFSSALPAGPPSPLYPAVPLPTVVLIEGTREIACAIAAVLPAESPRMAHVATMQSRSNCFKGGRLRRRQGPGTRLSFQGRSASYSNLSFYGALIVSQVSYIAWENGAGLRL